MRTEAATTFSRRVARKRYLVAFFGETISDQRRSSFSMEELPDELYVLRGTKVSRTYGADENLYISLFLLLITIVGPIYYGPP